VTQLALPPLVQPSKGGVTLGRARTLKAAFGAIRSPKLLIDDAESAGLAYGVRSLIAPPTTSHYN